jgi:hypothetical protein
VGSGGSTDVTPDGGDVGTPEAGAFDDGGGDPNCPSPATYEGAIAMLDCGPVPPVVKMDCPGDPTLGWTEYKDTFRIEHPYNLSVADRFKIENGILTFWVLPNDKPHTSTTSAKDPRTEAAYAQRFTTGMRMWSADVYWERSVRDVVVMQVHTTASGIGPVYLHFDGEDLPPIKASQIPGGLMERWLNMKVAINAATTESTIWINNCQIATQTGERGDGRDYFKHGVYHCSAPLCRDHYKNIHLYMK